MAANPKIVVPAASREGSELLLELVRLRAQRHVLWMRSEWAQSLQGLADSSAIGHAEIEHLLREPSECDLRRGAFYQTDPAARQLSEQSDAVEAEFAHDPAWSRLRRQFGLSLLETHLLALAAAVEIDPALRRVYAYLQDNSAAGYASPWLASALFTGERPAMIAPHSPLIQWRLARPTAGSASPWASDAPWTIDPSLVFWLLGRTARDAALDSAVRLSPQSLFSGEPCLYPEQLHSMLEFLGAVHGAAVEIELLAETGAGKRTLAGQLAATLGCDLITVDAPLLLPPELSAAESGERIVRALRMARLTGGLLYWNGGERTSLRIWQAAGGSSSLMLFGAVTAAGSSSQSSAARRSFALPRLRKELRIQLWNRLSQQPVPRLVADRAVKPADIAQAAQIAAAGEDAIVELFQDSGRVAPGDVFTTMPCPFTWDDIVLHHGVREHLRELEQQVRLSSSVYEEWGFDRLCPMGRGITALFAGPSGAGKTMAAQVLARSLNLKLLRVDLAGVVNKYIGETEKRLKQVFDACERANVLLFFDEADALFGQRTQVKDAHDRFANIEIDYLLQRMEEFEGVAVLATNRKGDLDKAFLRRIRFIVDFLSPGPAERLALWQRALAPHHTTGEEILGPIDWGFLAHKLTMTGADITATALNAAFLARAQGSRITMEHVLQAARREMTKHGIVVRQGEWGG